MGNGDQVTKTEWLPRVLPKSCSLPPWVRPPPLWPPSLLDLVRGGRRAENGCRDTGSKYRTLRFPVQVFTVYIRVSEARRT